MSRFRAATFGVLLVAGLLIPGPHPAQAHWTYCIVQGTWVTDAPVFLRGAGRSAHADFSFRASLAPCQSGLTINGHFIGWCDAAIGTGVVDDRDLHQFDYTTAAFTLTFRGPGAVGSAKLVPEAGQDCVNGATRFLLTGSFMAL